MQPAVLKNTRVSRLFIFSNEMILLRRILAYVRTYWKAADKQMSQSTANRIQLIRSMSLDYDYHIDHYRLLDSHCVTEAMHRRDLTEYSHKQSASIIHKSKKL